MIAHRNTLNHHQSYQWIMNICFITVSKTVVTFEWNIDSSIIQVAGKLVCCFIQVADKLVCWFIQVADKLVAWIIQPGVTTVLETVIRDRLPYFESHSCWFWKLMYAKVEISKSWHLLCFPPKSKSRMCLWVTRPETTEVVGWELVFLVPGEGSNRAPMRRRVLVESAVLS